MRLKIKLFGVLSEIAGVDEVSILTSDTVSRDMIFEKLYTDYPAFRLVQCQLAINKVLIFDNCVIDLSDELVLLPPFAGG